VVRSKAAEFERRRRFEYEDARTGRPRVDGMGTSVLNTTAEISETTAAGR